MLSRMVIPEYPIPNELKDLLDNEKCSMQSAPNKYARAITALKSVDSIDIQERQYLQLLKLALYLEEHQINEEMKRYELFNQTINKILDPRMNSNLSLFQIVVDDLDEERRWIRPNDYVDVIDVCDKKIYTLRVTRVTQIDIIASDDERRFYKHHKRNKLYDIQFRFHNYPIRCAHYALSLMDLKGTVHCLFPEKRQFQVENNNYVYGAFQTINPNIAGNFEQKQAIWHIVNRSSFPAPYILYGPPGTGKTATVVEAVCQILQNSLGHVLICTPSNTAGDEIARRLLAFLPATLIYRMYSTSKNSATIDEDLKLCSNFEQNTIVSPKFQDVFEKRIIITTLCNSIRLVIMNVPFAHFSHVFIDEAGQGSETEMLIPISLVSECAQLHSQIVFAGDPQQLGPTIFSKLAKRILGRSILERLMSYELYQKDCDNRYNPRYITKLLQNYRNHPDIIHVSNKLFYDAELIAKCPRRRREEKFPIIFHGIEGVEEKCPYSPSVCNYNEIGLVLKYVNGLLETGLGFGKISAKDIGIVTPFTLQSKKIRKALKARKIRDINVGTVELFQGQERKVVIMTTVRAKTFISKGKEHIGFLSNPKRFNVAVTRAKQLLIIIGDPNILQIDDQWRYLIKFCIFNDSYMGLKFSLCNLRDEKNNASSNLVKSSALFQKEDLYSLFSNMEVFMSLMDELEYCFHYTTLKPFA